jgi:xanthine dehydrogenase accessory factor
MSIWKFIYSKHADNTDVILLYVLSSTGSSPGRRGFKMAVAADGTFEGSIGGGIMEHKFVEMARSVLQEGTALKSDTYRQVHAKDKGSSQSGMICSGEQTIFLHRIDEHDLPAVKKMMDAEGLPAKSVLLLTEQGIGFSNEVMQEDFYYEEHADGFLLKEKAGLKNTIHIIGGGHCALALSQLMRQMDFYIHVYDDRQDLDTLRKNSFAHEMHILKSYADLDTFIHEGPHVFVVIMTFGYRTDDIAVRALLDKKFSYTGVMGSKKRWSKCSGCTGMKEYLKKN